MSRPTILASTSLPGSSATSGAEAADASRGAGSAVERQQLAQLAAEFESMLVLQMIKTMRQSMLDEDAEGEGLGADTFSSTIDTELSRTLALHGGVGLQQYMMDAWDRQQGGAGETAAARPVPGAAVGMPVNLPARASIDVVAAVASASRPSHAPDPSGTAGLTGLAATATSHDTSRIGLEIAGRVSSAYGWRGDPLHGRTKFHGGIDLAARYGTEVPAAADGTVVSAGEQGGYGLTVVVKHRDGFQTRYAHLSAIDVREGDPVSKGALLGRVGSTGRSTGPHLHFEVLQGGERIDPGQFVRNLTGDIKGQ